MIEIYELTFKQFYEQECRDLAKLYNESIAEIKRNHPMGAVKQRHFDACFEAAKKGIVLSRVVLDSLHWSGRYRIFHDLPDYGILYFKEKGTHYILPEARNKFL